MWHGSLIIKMHLFVIFGASGDLSHKKTFPALFRLYQRNFFSSGFKLIGYARTNQSLEEFRTSIKNTLLENNNDSRSLALVDDFLSFVFYCRGNYDSDVDIQQLYTFISSIILNSSNIAITYYLAVPSIIFHTLALKIRSCLYNLCSKNRIVIEKPFGKTFADVCSLDKCISNLFDEEEVFRIDHYLGKEMVKAILTLRFSNRIFSSCWNNECIDMIQIVFKENFGIYGRAGYFNEYGIIKDIIQNHLLQILTIVAMDQPISISSHDIRDEKVILKIIT